MRIYKTVGLLSMLGVLLACATGCLSLGTKTTYVQESPEAQARLNSLEKRVGALEATLSGGTVASEPIPGP